ncbi:MAG: pentapeptide repeat-containing protein [Crocosphaera sp.]
MSPKPIFSNIISSDSSSYSSPVENASYPYVGLKSFENNPTDSQFFFGRETLIQQLLNNLEKHHFLALVGGLGNGKSSLLQAGLLYHLSSSQTWETKLIQPSQHPLQSLAMALADNSLPILQKAEQIAEIQMALEQSPENISYFIEKLSTPKLLLAIDNFEEIFTLCQSAKERWQFISCLLTALEKYPQKFTLITIINEEFLTYCFEQKPRKLGQKIQENLIFITPLNQQERYDVITLPAQQANLELESQLVEALLRDSQNLTGSLPLLQYALWQICRFRSNFQLTFSSYQQLGGVRKVLDRQAMQILQQLTRIQQKTAKKLFLSLIKTHEKMGHICYSVSQKKLENLTDFHYVLQQFHEGGFIKIEKKSSFGNQEAFLRLSHPIIIQYWPLLKQWLEQRQYCLQEQKKLTEAAEQWHISNRDKQYLLADNRLKTVKTLQRDHIKFSPLTQEFIKQSSKQKLRNTLLYALLPLTIITFIGGFTYRHWQIETARNTLELVKDNPYDTRRKDALEMLNFWGINLQNIPLAATYLKGINLTNTNLSNMDFSGANLENANLSQSKIVNSNFKTSHLPNSRLVQSNLSNSNFRLSNLTQGNLRKANLFQTNLTFASLNFANLASTNLSKSSLYFADLEGANLLKSNLSRSNLSGANLSFTNLMFSDLAHANLSSANLVKANLSSADLTNTNLLGANLIQSKNLHPTRLKKACFWQYAIYKGKWDRQQQEWKIDEVANRKFIEELIQDKSSDPKIQPTC